MFFFFCIPMLRVKLIGSEGQDAVLVTGGQTFKLTKAETSNTLLLLPPEGTCGDGSDGGGGSDGVAGAGGEGGFEAVAAVGFQYEVWIMSLGPDPRSHYFLHGGMFFALFVAILSIQYLLIYSSGMIPVVSCFFFVFVLLFLVHTIICIARWIASIM